MLMPGMTGVVSPLIALIREPIRQRSGYDFGDRWACGGWLTCP